MSKLTDICIGCCLRRRAGNYSNGFPKRLLVATSVVVIIAMFLVPAEAFGNKRRHQRRQPENAAQLTKEMPASMKQPKKLSIELFKNATRKITKKLRNTKRFFDQERKILNETKEYRDGMPEWLPTVNFVDIHYHDYKSSRKNASITEKKFSYLMPKLYKSLKEYETIFQRLNIVQVDLSDDPFSNYKMIRQKLIDNTLHRLYSTIAEISENMYAVKMPTPPFDKNRMKLEFLKIKVDATQCLKNDYLAFRGYGNLLSNWYSEFRCPRNRKNTRKCKDFEAKLDFKRENRRLKNKANLFR